MPRKKSVMKSASQFRNSIGGILDFSSWKYSTKLHESWAHEYAILRLYREFESLVLNALVGAINNQTETLTSRSGIKFPRHLTDEVCEYLIVRNGYFDFKGRDGLIKTIKSYVPDEHYLLKAVSRAKYKAALEQLSALRNFAAHNSSFAKKKAKEVVGQSRMPDAGSWLKTKGRLSSIVNRLVELADEIEAGAPY